MSAEAGLRQLLDDPTTAIVLGAIPGEVALPPPPTGRHGLRSTYTNGRCLCPFCSQADRDYQRQRRDGLVVRVHCESVR